MSSDPSISCSGPASATEGVRGQSCRDSRRPAMHWQAGQGTHDQMRGGLEFEQPRAATVRVPARSSDGARKERYFGRPVLTRNC